MNTEQRCRTCRYNDIGLCRINPPTPSLSGQSLWPRVSGGDWCSKHQPRYGQGTSLYNLAMKFAEDNAITVRSMQGAGRTWDIAHPRQDFMLLAKSQGYSLSEIARFLNRDHTTVLSGIQSAERRMNGGIK